jgi:tetratricopeptide (TPR) repeat protein
VSDDEATDEAAAPPPDAPPAPDAEPTAASPGAPVAEPERRPRAAQDDRLLELVSALGGADPGALREAVAALRAARQRGEQVDLAGVLAERGVVPRGVLDDLLGGDEERPRSGLGAVPTDDESDVAAPEPAPRRRKGRRGSDGERARPARRPSDEEPGRPPARRPSADDLPRAPVRRTSADELPRAPRRSARQEPVELRPPPPRRSARQEPVTPSAPPGGEPPERAEPSPAPFANESSTASFELETRRFDPAALAAASTRPRRGLPPFVMPAALATGLLLVTVSVVGAVRRLGQDDEPVALVTDSPAPATPDAPDDELPEDEVPLEPPDPWPELAERARTLREAERYGEARSLLEGAPLHVRVANTAELAPTLEDLRALERFKEEADAALSEADGLVRKGEHAAAARRVQALLDANLALVGSPTGRRVEAARVEALAARAEAAPAPAPAGVEAEGGRAEPPERVAHFAAQAARGRELVQAVQQRVKQDQARLVELRRAEAARARATTEREPIDLEVAPGYVIAKAIIDDMDERGFTARPSGSADAITRSWSSVPAELALRVRRLAVREDVADDQLRLGRWCLAEHHFDEARAAFARAATLDPKLMGKVPDVSEVVRAGRLFGGALRHSGTSLELTYGFARPAEAADFQDQPGARGVLRDGRLEVRGRGTFLTALTEIGFEGNLEVRATFGPASRDGLSVMGVAFAAGTRREVAYLVAVARGPGDLLVLQRQGGRVRTLERRLGLLKGDDGPVTLEVLDDKLRVKALRRTQVKLDLTPSWEGARVVLGGVAPEDGAGSIDALTVRGAVRPDWLRKALGEVDAKLRAMLAGTDELPVFVPPSVRPLAPPLSAEDALGLDGVSPEALEVYREGRVKAATGAPLDTLAAANAFERALELSPGFAAASYRRALALEALGRPHLALTGLEQAAEQCPRFYEAISERARILARLGRLDEARASAEAALAVRPDHAPAWAARGLVAFTRGELGQALGDFDVALALDPWNEEVRARRRNVSHVVAGPPWQRHFKTDTKHFTVETDISQKRCDEYARDLEAVRGFYAERFGLAASARAPRKAKVLIFDTREGFHAYAELTTDDRVESLLGCYLPRYRQLLLYEDKDDASLEETRRVLFHEGFHQFIDGLVEDLPYWVNEGLAEYFSTCRVEAGGAVVPPDGTSRLEARLDELRRFLGRGGGPLPFARLMNESPAEFYSGPVAVKYAQAWAMVHFFEHGGSTLLRERFRRYVAALRDGMEARRAFHAAWDGVDWAEVQGAWVEYVKRL